MYGVLRRLVKAGAARAIAGAPERFAAAPLIGATEMTDRDIGVVSETAAIAEVATSQIALDITLLARRTKKDVRGVMAKMLGVRVGRLDSLLS